VTPEFRSFASKAAAGAALADHMAVLLDQALARRGAAALALPGGRSPLPLFDALFARPLAWERISLTLTDDRWVPPASPDSNQGLVRRHLEGRPAAAAHFIGLVSSAPAPAHGLAEIGARLATLPDRFDAVVLGLGDDGHVASLFPGQPLDGDGPCLAGLAPKPPQARISLGLGRLLATRALFLLFGGDHRLGLARRPPSGLPIAAVLEQTAVPVEVFHYHD
jgi:6-phosphogluconolactonase